MEDIMWKYNSSKNRDGVFLPGVPLRDLTKEEYKALPKHLQQSVKASPLYTEYTEASEKATPAPKQVTATKPEATDTKAGGNE